MSLKVKTLFTEPLFFYLVLLNYIRPDSYNYIGLPSVLLRLTGIWDKLFCLLILFLCVLSFLEDSKCGINDIIIYYAYKMIGTVVVCSILYHMYSGSGVFTHIRRLSAIWYIALAMKYNYRNTINHIAFLLSVLVFVNWATILLFPHGMYNDGNWQCYFLGYDNGHMVVFMPALFFSLQHARYSRKKLLFIITWISVYTSALICRSATTVVGLAALMFILVMIYVPAVRNFLFNWKTVLAVIAGIFFFIIIFRKQEIFQDLMMKYLGKDSTFTGRVNLWDAALKVYRQHLWFGIGDSAEANMGIFRLGTQKLSYAHNEILDIMVRSGIVGLALYFLIIFDSIRVTRRRRDHMGKVWLAFMASYWLSMMFESYSNYPMYFFYFVLIAAPRYETVSARDYRKKTVVLHG